MTEKSDNLPPIVKLKYRAGETIMKAGDYGVSIYQILDGWVEIFLEADGKDVRLAKLGPGQFIGEMSFLSGTRSRRSASVRALGPTVVEAWHPDRFAGEYEKMPFVLRYMADQVIGRLKRMNRMINKLEAARPESRIIDPWAAKRKHRRKEVDIECIYRPAQQELAPILQGRVRDLSKAGMRLEILDSNINRFSHEPGNEVLSNFMLPSGNRIDLLAKIVRRYGPETQGVLELGLQFQKMNQDAAQKLGFFLMSKT